MNWKALPEGVQPKCHLLATCQTNLLSGLFSFSASCAAAAAAYYSTRPRPLFDSKKHTHMECMGDNGGESKRVRNSNNKSFR